MYLHNITVALLIETPFGRDAVAGPYSALMPVVYLHYHCVGVVHEWVSLRAWIYTCIMHLLSAPGGVGIWTVDFFQCVFESLVLRFAAAHSHALCEHVFWKVELNHNNNIDNNGKTVIILRNAETVRPTRKFLYVCRPNTCVVPPIDDVDYRVVVDCNVTIVSVFIVSETPHGETKIFFNTRRRMKRITNSKKNDLIKIIRRRIFSLSANLLRLFFSILRIVTILQ